MNEQTANRTYDEEPSLFEEKKEVEKKGKGKIFFFILILGAAIIFWPRGIITSESVLQAERLAKIGLTSSGVLKELLCEKGARVKKGAVIARFENPEIQRKFEERKLALEILRLDKARLEKKTEFHSQEKDRKQILFENGVSGRAEFERAAHELDEAKEELAIKGKEIESAEGEVEFLKTRVESLDLKAPFDGVLLTYPGAQVGSPFREGEFVLEFADPESYFLEVLVLEKEIHKVALGNSVEAKFQAFPWKTFKGEVVRIAPRTMDEVEKVFKVRHVVPCEIRLTELPPDVKYGMRAQVKIKMKERGIQKK